MPEVKINVGGRDYTVACQDGEEHFLQSAAKMLDAEAAVLVEQIGRMPESRMLLMAGLMLADKTAGLEDQLREAQERLTAQDSEMEALRQRPAPEPTRVEVPVVPAGLSETMAELAARAEALASRVEEGVNEAP